MMLCKVYKKDKTGPVQRYYKRDDQEFEILMFSVKNFNISMPNGNHEVIIKKKKQQLLRGKNTEN